MNIKYNTPYIHQDGSIQIEQVIVMKTGQMENGIKRRELKVIQELYPNLELLKETIVLAERNYNDVSMQEDKTVGLLEAEKSALKELKIMIDNL